jgi:23S rRNA pseudouridine2457 synthase
VNPRNFIIYKPAGFLSQFIANTRKNKNKFLGELAEFPEETMAIGRLDATSEGLLFLTTSRWRNYRRSCKPP